MCRVMALVVMTAVLHLTAVNMVGLSQEVVTFSEDVAPIIFEKCVGCHRPNEAAPMSLRSYQEVRPWARGIRDKVVSREMPPWFANPLHGSFKNDQSLTDDEINTVVSWVDAGAPQGEPSQMPELPEFTDGWTLGEPDYIIEFPEVAVPANGPDYYPDLSVTMDDLPEKR